MAASTAIDRELVERFRQALDRLNPSGAQIGLAVSGGPDSMAMLLLAHEAIPGGFAVATVDHGLRPQAKDECALVMAACEERVIACEVLTVQVGEGNVQAKAREARYDALGAWAKWSDLSAIATAHHADDQMETMLMRLNRGSGVSGLSGIRELTTFGESLRVIRPLLSFSREELAQVVAAAHLETASDPSNADTSFERVRMRQALQKTDCFDPKGFAASARHIEQADMLCEVAVERWLFENEKTISGGLRNPPPPDRAMEFPLLQAQFRMMGKQPRGSDLVRLLEQLRQGQGGNVVGVLVTVEDGDWVFRPEPPRRTR